jgi:hypothetical protein
MATRAGNADDSGGSSDSRCVCLVTIHGIGFEQRPTAGEPWSGYADMLHARLSEALNGGGGPSLLSDDPHSQRKPRKSDKKARLGQTGPIYVESSWPPPEPGQQETKSAREAGLKRLGAWRHATPEHVVGAIKVSDEAQLAEPGRPIAHVALVYSHLEDQGPRVGSAADTLARTALSAFHYDTLFGEAKMLYNDTVALLFPPHVSVSAPDDLPPSLRVRSDVRHRVPHLHIPLTAPAKEPQQQPSEHSHDVVFQLMDDVATYIVRDDLRQRVRSFVREALLRLIYRDDVAGIVINAHSQGTIVAYDVLSQLSPFEASKIWWLVTAGSPIRKYVRLFAWSAEIGALREIGLREDAGHNADGREVLPVRWTNFYDERDPVADPLRGEKREDAPPKDNTDEKTLLNWVNPTSGDVCPVAVEDVEAYNVQKVSSGGLRAHNYWDNQEDFIKPLVDRLREDILPRLKRQEAATATKP